MEGISSKVLRSVLSRKGNFEAGGKGYTVVHDTIGRPMEILLVEDNLSDARLAIESLKDGHIQHRLTLMCDGEETIEFLTRVGRFARHRGRT